jgi:hypothetical protein
MGGPAVMGQCCLLQVLNAPALKWFFQDLSVADRGWHWELVW